MPCYWMADHEETWKLSPFSSWFQPRRVNCFDEIARNATYEFSNVGIDIPVRGLIYNEVQNKTFPGKLRWLG